MARKSNQQWVWLVLCRRTRQILSYVVGPRDEAHCRALWAQIPDDYKECFSFSDYYACYRTVFPKELHFCVGKASGQTNHIERFNCTLRQRLGRFVRKTLSFSKMKEWHERVLKIFLWNYNIDCQSKI